MKQFIVRDEKGKMVAVIGRKVLNSLMVDISGFWREYKVENKLPIKCFEITRDCSYGLGNGNCVFRLYLWNGYKIVEGVCNA